MANEKRNLIDRDELIDSLGASDMEIFAKEVIDEAPLVDAVEVVRCRDCKHWDELEDTFGGGYCNHQCWFVLDAEPPIVNHSYFCSHGERKDNG